MLYWEGGWTMSSVIHVDNSKFFRKLMQVFMAELGLECESYEMGEDVLDAVLNKKISCMITGLELPDMTGEELIRRVSISAPPMTIIAVTSSKNEERIYKLYGMGVKGIIQKGSDWKEKLRELF
jgi:two-component system nitrogen regulation response regulator GlnG